ncbi:hypothetical protein IG631_18205 [Alternaria alternata]|nr:hypothetical protein IG631_18205 [Alternaria alternata]
MVYRGRPSTGCKKCRERKIKVSNGLPPFIRPKLRCEPLQGMPREVAVACRLSQLASSQLGIQCEMVASDLSSDLCYESDLASVMQVAD